MLPCCELVFAWVQNWFPWKLKVKAPEPIAVLVNGVQVTVGEYTNWTTPGPLFGVPHWPNTETGIENWMSRSFWTVVLKALYRSYTPFRSWVTACVKSVDSAGWVRSTRGFEAGADACRPPPVLWACAASLAAGSAPQTSSAKPRRESHVTLGSDMDELPCSLGSRRSAIVCGVVLVLPAVQLAGDRLREVGRIGG